MRLATRILLATSLLALSGQPSSAQQDKFWQGIYEGCLKSTNAPTSSVIAKSYCTCSTNSIYRNYSFDQRMVIAVKIHEKSLDRATEGKLKKLAFACLKSAVQKYPSSR
jgi:hypothetical protein